MAFNLKDFRKEYNLKQTDIADILNCKQAYISVAERLYKDLTTEQMEKLFDLYGKENVMEYYVSPEEHKKTRDRLLVDPESDFELMRKEYLSLVNEMMSANNDLRKEISNMQKSISKLTDVVLSQQITIEKFSDNKKTGTAVGA